MKVIYADATNATHDNVRKLFSTLGVSNEYERIGHTYKSRVCNLLAQADRVALVVAHNSPSAADLRAWLAEDIRLKDVNVIRIGISAGDPGLTLSNKFEGDRKSVV